MRFPPRWNVLSGNIIGGLKVMNSFALLSCTKNGEVSHCHGASHRAEQKPMTERCTGLGKAMPAQTFSLY